MVGPGLSLHAQMRAAHACAPGGGCDHLQCAVTGSSPELPTFEGQEGSEPPRNPNVQGLPQVCWGQRVSWARARARSRRQSVGDCVLLSPAQPWLSNSSRCFVLHWRKPTVKKITNQKTWQQIEGSK